MSKKIHVTTTINGEQAEFLCEARQSLLEVLRDSLRLTGAKEGCNNGNCGACTVMLDGRLVNSCLVLGVEVQGKSVTTVEGVASAEIFGGQQFAMRLWLDPIKMAAHDVTASDVAAAIRYLATAPEPAGHSDVPLLLVNHKPSWATNLEYERGRQAVLTAGFVEELVERTGQHVILAGDMDAMPDAESIRFLRGLQALDGTSVSYRDAWELTHGTEPGPTFVPSTIDIVEDEWRADLDRRIDYVLVRCGRAGPTMNVTHCTRTFDGPLNGVWPSDHCGVVADLDLAG